MLFLSEHTDLRDRESVYEIRCLERGTYESSYLLPNINYFLIINSILSIFEDTCRTQNGEKSISTSLT